MLKRGWVLFAALFVWLTVSVVQAQDFLPPERAFAMQARQVSPTQFSISYRIADGYYMYRDRFEFSRFENVPLKLEKPSMPPGIVKYDPTFEQDMTLYFGSVEFVLDLPRWPDTQQPRPFAIDIVSQGCAEAGLCYPPMTSSLFVQPDQDGYVLLSQQPIIDLDRPRSALSVSVGSVETAGLTQLFSSASDVGIAEALEGRVLWEIIFLFFALGVLLSLTPCVLPMIPILSVLIVGQKQQVTKIRGLILAGAYVLGMSGVYTVLGIVAGLMGAGLAAWLQTPWLLALFAVLLVILALGMFDVFSIEMPGVVQERLGAYSRRLPGGKFAASFAMGAISALIVGPCVAAPLAGALLYISRTGDVLLGGSALFAMAWGMGLPLLAVGASAGTLLPKAGAWMQGVKNFFGVLLLATAVWMISPVLSAEAIMVAWSLLALFSAVLLGAFDSLGNTDTGHGGRLYLWNVVRKTVGLFLTLLAAIWLFSVASGGTSLLKPLGHLKASQTLQGSTEAVGKLDFRSINSVDELKTVLQEAKRPVMLDFYADWCVSCKEMEAFTFSNAEVAEKMRHFVLLKADVTKNTPEHRALLKRFSLFGPPGIMFFDADGNYLEHVRVIGFQDAQRFSETLDKVMSERPS